MTRTAAGWLVFALGAGFASGCVSAPGDAPGTPAKHIFYRAANPAAGRLDDCSFAVPADHLPMSGELAAPLPVVPVEKFSL